MLSARILIVSDRREVAAELAPVIRAEQHLASVVPTARELLDLLDSGLVPDMVITDLGSPGAEGHAAYATRFRQLNRTGCHVVVTEPEGAGAETVGDTRATELRRPLDPERVRTELSAALRKMESEMHSTRAEVWRSMDRLRREVEDVRAEMVRVLALTIAARDEYMNGHAERVAALCEAMGEEAALSEPQRRRLRTAAQLHEIGKIALPVELLQKKDDLTESELERIRSHAQIGAGILREVPSLAPVASMVEHLGTPYAELPAALDPDVRTMLGILRVADVWDAVTSARAYRPSMPRNYWEPLLRGGAGTLFDPAAVPLLFRVLTGPAATIDVVLGIPRG